MAIKDKHGQINKDGQGGTTSHKTGKSQQTKDQECDVNNNMFLMGKYMYMYMGTP